MTGPEYIGIATLGASIVSIVGNAWNAHQKLQLSVQITAEFAALRKEMGETYYRQDVEIERRASVDLRLAKLEQLRMAH